MSNPAFVEQTTVTFLDQKRLISSLDWVPHASFSGVCLKHLVKGADTEGQFSCHMVRVDPGCALKLHAHQTQWELHEVVGGSGEAQLNGRPVAYRAGQVTVIPRGVEHSVNAGEQGLMILAKFVPALL